MATTLEKQITCGTKYVLTTTSSLQKKFSPAKRELQSEEMTPGANWIHMCGKTPLLHARHHGQEGRGGGRGWRNVKVSQDHMTSKS